MRIVDSNSLIIQQLNQEDCKSLFVLTALNRQYLRQWLPWLDDVNKQSDTESYIDACLLQKKMGKAAHYSLYYKKRLVGLIAIENIGQSQQQGSIGYWLAQAEQGKGLMQQALLIICKIAFNELNLTTLNLTCATGNSKSQKVATACGFLKTGCKKEAEWLYDHYVDHNIYKLTRKKYCQIIKA